MDLHSFCAWIFWSCDRMIFKLLIKSSLNASRVWSQIWGVWSLCFKIALGCVRSVESVWSSHRVWSEFVCWVCLCLFQVPASPQDGRIRRGCVTCDLPVRATMGGRTRGHGGWPVRRRAKKSATYLLKSNIKVCWHVWRAWETRCTSGIKFYNTFGSGVISNFSVGNFRANIFARKRFPTSEQIC